ncbi:uncharacterized protein TNCV_1614361 [Trichonephila clavipes]|nr:uncharacterized protein TNCV_1614361 [Trichonephila clavipes]
MINGRTRLHVVANGTMTGQRYIDEVLLPHVRLFRGAVGDKFVFMDDNATCHRTLAVQDCLDNALGRQVAGRNYPPTNKNTPIRALTEEWDKLPQQLLDNVVQKNVGKDPLTPSGLLKLVKRFEETGKKLEDRARAGRPYLKEARAHCIAVEKEVIASEAASGTSSAREAARRLGLPPSSVHNIVRRILQLYPYKLSCHELLPADTAQRKHLRIKMEQDPTWIFDILWTDEAHFYIYGRPLIHV